MNKFMGTFFFIFFFTRLFTNALKKFKSLVSIKQYHILITLLFVACNRNFTQKIATNKFWDPLYTTFYGKDRYSCLVY